MSNFMIDGVGYHTGSPRYKGRAQSVSIQILEFQAREIKDEMVFHQTVKASYIVGLKTELHKAEVSGAMPEVEA
jgi:hypothetical protein